MPVSPGTTVAASLPSTPCPNIPPSDLSFDMFLPTTLPFSMAYHTGLSDTTNKSYPLHDQRPITRHHHSASNCVSQYLSHWYHHPKLHLNWEFCRWFRKKEPRWLWANASSERGWALFPRRNVVGLWKSGRFLVSVVNVITLRFRGAMGKEHQC